MQSVFHQHFAYTAYPYVQCTVHIDISWVRMSYIAIHSNVEFFHVGR